MKKISIAIVLFFMATSVLATHAVLLVSLGMPDRVLTAYLKQGKQYHIPIVIRGLYTKPTRDAKNTSKPRFIGSFKDTANRLKQLVQQSKVGGISINPLLFRAFHINVVPAFVVYDDNVSCIPQTAHHPDVPCAKDRFDVIFGNLPVAKLLSFVAKRSTSEKRSHFSQTLLLKYNKAGESA